MHSENRAYLVIITWLVLPAISLSAHRIVDPDSIAVDHVTKSELCSQRYVFRESKNPVLRSVELTMRLIVQGIDELSWTSSVYSKFRARLKPNLFVEVFVDDVLVGRTKVIKGNLKPAWGDSLTM